MANPTCNATTLNTNGAQYCAQNGCSPHDRKALQVYFMVLQLKAIGGTDYTPNQLAQLVQDTESFECGETDDQEDAALTALLSSQATAAGASVPVGVSAQLANIALFRNQTDDTLNDCMLLLKCKLGVHKAYPQ